jgi:hypothetical protein
MARFAPAQRLALPRTPSALGSIVAAASGRRLGLLVYGGGLLDAEPKPGQYESRYYPSAFQQVRCAQ